MNEWKGGQEADNVTFIPDGNGDFSEGMAYLSTNATWAWASAHGAIRCW
jgi:peroxiredoxin